MRNVKLLSGACILVAFMMTFSSDYARSSELQLRRSFWSGWKYSVDGENWEGVGFSGKSLSALLEGNSRAQEEMEGYKSAKTRALITGLSSGGLSVAAAVLYFDDKDWEAPEISLLAGGIVLGIVTSYFENSAVNHLLGAVHIYNRSRSTSATSSLLDNSPFTLKQKGVDVFITLSDFP